MIVELVTLISSAPVGALIGGLLAAWNRKTDLEAKRLDHQLERDRWQHDRGLRELDLQQVRAEAEGKREVAIVEGAATAEAARMAALAAAHAADKVGADELREAGGWRWLLVIVSFVQRIVRPGLTAALVGAALWINVEMLTLLKSVWPSLAIERQIEAAMLASSWVLAQGSACIQYWMVSRGAGK